MGAEGIEAQAATLLAVAIDHHRIDRLHPCQAELTPDLQRGQQFVGGMVQHIHAHVPGALAAACGTGLVVDDPG